MYQDTLITVHGILSNGIWHQTLARVVGPFFDYKQVRYREYHAFGPINMFFWPWGLFFAGLLGLRSLTLENDPNVTYGVMAATALLALFAIVRSGLARTIPWLLVGAFWMGASRENIPVLGWLGLTVVIASFDITRSIRWIDQSPCSARFKEVSKRSLYVYWLAGLALIGILEAAGWALRTVEMATLLAVLAVLIGIYLSNREIDWKGWTILMPVPIALGALGGGALYLQWFADPAQVIWYLLIAQMLFLEVREASDKGNVDWLWIGIILIAAVLIAFSWSVPTIEPMAGFGAAFAMLVAGWLEPQHRVTRAVHRVLREVEAIRAQVGEVSWIAHSLGTYLSGKAFSEYPMQLRRTILVGGAISESYDWKSQMNDQTLVIHDIRNEHGTQDIVIRLLWMAGSWARRQGLGGAGWVGLWPPSPIACHNVENHRAACQQCPADPPVRIHNYPMDRFGHSTYFVREEHIRDFWRPYLLGHSPHEVKQLYEDCAQIYKFHSGPHANRSQYRKMLSAFLEKRWNWYLRQDSPQTFEEQVFEEVGEQIEILRATYPDATKAIGTLVVETAATYLARSVTLARIEETKLQRDPRVLLFLNPPTAIASASKVACNLVAEALAAGEFSPVRA